MIRDTRRSNKQSRSLELITKGQDLKQSGFFIAGQAYRQASACPFSTSARGQRRLQTMMCCDPDGTTSKDEQGGLCFSLVMTGKSYKHQCQQQCSLLLRTTAKACYKVIKV